MSKNKKTATPPPGGKKKGFISFSDVAAAPSSGGSSSKQTGKYSSTGGFNIAGDAQTLPVYTGSDTDLLMLSRKLLKKDVTTKLKALTELCAVLPTKDSEMLRDFLPYMVYAYTKLSFENARSIRELVNKALFSIIEVEKRLLEPHMKTLIGPWWVMSADPVGEVSDSALAAFHRAIPPKKRQPVLVHLFPFIAAYWKKSLLLTVQSFRDASAGNETEQMVEDAKEKYERSIAAAVKSIALLVVTLTPEQNRQLINGIADTTTPDWDEQKIIGYSSILDGSKLSSLLKSEFLLIRLAAVELLQTFTGHVPDVLHDATNTTESSFFSKSLCKHLLVAVNDTSSQLSSAALQCFAAVVRQFGGAVWRHVAFHRQLLPQLKALVLKGSEVAIEYVLPIVASLPFEKISIFCETNDESDSSSLREDNIAGIIDFIEFLKREVVRPQIDELTAILMKLLKNRSDSSMRRSWSFGQLQLSGLSCAVQSIVCVAEVGTLMLLRREQTSAAGTLEPPNLLQHGSTRLRQVNCIVDIVMGSIRDIAPAFFFVLLADVSERPADVQELISSNRLTEYISVCYGSTSTAEMQLSNSLLKSVVDAFESLRRVITQLGRATSKNLNIARDDWLMIFWRPLAEIMVAEIVSRTSASTGAHEQLLGGTSTAMSIVYLLNAPEENATDEVVMPGQCVLLKYLAQLLFDETVRSSTGNEQNIILVCITVQLLLSIWRNPCLAPSVEDVDIFCCGDWICKLLRYSSDATVSAQQHDMILAVLYDTVSYIFKDDSTPAERHAAYLKHCMSCNSIDGLIALWEIGGLQSSFPEVVRDWIGDGAMYLLSQQQMRSPDRLSIYFLLLLVCRSGLTNVSRTLTGIVLQEFNSIAPSGLLVSYMGFNFIHMALKPSVSSADRSAADMGLELLDDSLRQCLLCHLRDAFFNRCEAESVRVTVGHNTDFLLDWAAVEKQLLPRLPCQHELVELICRTLNIFLEGNTTKQNGDVRNIPYLSNIPPDVWCDHFYALCRMSHQLGICDTALSTLIIFQVQHWRSLAAADGHRRTGEQLFLLFYSLSCVEHMLQTYTSVSDEVFRAFPFWNEAELLLELQTLLRGEATAAADDPKMVEECAAFDRLTNALDLWTAKLCNHTAIIQKMISTYSSTFVESEESIIQNSRRKSTLGTIAASIENFAPTETCVAVSRPAQRRFQTLFSVTSEEFMQNKEVFLVADADVSSCEVNSRTISKIHATSVAFEALQPSTGEARIKLSDGAVVSVSTLRLCATADSATQNHEYVAKLHNVTARTHSALTATSHTSSSNDRSSFGSYCDAFSWRGADHTDAVGAVLWLLERAIEYLELYVLTDRQKKVPDGFDLSSITLENAIRCYDVLHMLIQQVDRRFHTFDDATKEQFLERSCALLRGHVLLLTAQDLTRHFTAWRFGLLLLKTSLMSNVVRSNGLWLPPVVDNLRRSATAIINLASETNKIVFDRRDDAMTALLQSLTCILNIFGGYNDIEETVIEILPVALSCIPSKADGFATSLLDALCHAWTGLRVARSIPRKSGQTAADRELASWEVEGLDFAMYVLLEGVQGYLDSDIRPLACKAIHNCFLKRSRGSCAALLDSSLISTFKPRLLALITNIEHDAWLLLTASTVATMRLAACKLLDCWFAACTGSVVVDAIDQYVESCEAEDEENIQEVERKEFERDEATFISVVGAELFEIISFNKEGLIQRNTAERGTDAVEAQEEADDDCSDSEDQNTNTGDSDTTSTDEGNDEKEEDAEKQSKSYFHTILNAASSIKHQPDIIPAAAIIYDELSLIFTWLLVLQKIDATAVQKLSTRARCGLYTKRSGIFSRIMDVLLDAAGDLLQFPVVSALLQRTAALNLKKLKHRRRGRHPVKASESSVADDDSILEGSVSHLAVYAIFRTVCTLPAMFRTFWSDECTRVQKMQLKKFVEQRIRSSLISKEIALIAEAEQQQRWDSNEFRVKGSTVSGEISAVLIHEETTVEVKIKVPPSYPLTNVEVTCTSRIGVSDGRWRQWVLQMIQLLTMRDGSVLDAILLWKYNIEKELDGVEPCPICYSILHAKSLALPSLPCPTCSNKFHPQCLYTWFRSSGKSKCVICQQPFFHH